MRRKANADAEEREKMQRKVNLEGWMLLTVKAADNAGFWYAENFKGFGEEEPSALPPFPAASIRIRSEFEIRFRVFETETGIRSVRYDIGEDFSKMLFLTEPSASVPAFENELKPITSQGLSLSPFFYIFPFSP